MLSLDGGLYAGSALILVLVPAYATNRHRARMRTPLEFKRANPGWKPMLNAYAIYFLVGLGVGAVFFAGRTGVNLIPKVPDAPSAWTALVGAVLGAIAVLGYVPREPSAVGEGHGDR